MERRSSMQRYFKTSYVEVYLNGQRDAGTAAAAFQNILCWSLSECQRCDSTGFWNFKTSYVEVYRSKVDKDSNGYLISKHLMLKFIGVAGWIRSIPAQISKHLMLKFIPVLHDLSQSGTHFKTSYVEVYPWCACPESRQNPISKHLMLKFIISHFCNHLRRQTFQNILCWSLSDSLLPPVPQIGWFQNILCWSLSFCWTPSKVNSAVFQNILCWSLSCSLKNGNTFSIGFQNILCWSLSSIRKKSYTGKTDFKTSYVEVYPCTDYVTKIVTEFQNILCWSLSGENSWLNAIYFYFKTSYVEVYRDHHHCVQCHVLFQNILCWSLSLVTHCFTFMFRRISKHLMLKFIPYTEVRTSVQM